MKRARAAKTSTKGRTKVAAKKSALKKTASKAAASRASRDRAAKPKAIASSLDDRSRIEAAKYTPQPLSGSGRAPFRYPPQ